MPEPQRIWTYKDAKAHLGELIERALTEGPQGITHRGRLVFVVAAEEFEKKAKPEGTLSEFLAASPLRGLRLRRLKRSRNKPRKIIL